MEWSNQHYLHNTLQYDTVLEGVPADTGCATNARLYFIERYDLRYSISALSINIYVHFECVLALIGLTG